MRTILDCERDVKGLHKWEILASAGGSPVEEEASYLYWCRECGAVGEGVGEKIIVLHRVKEKDDFKS